MINNEGDYMPAIQQKIMNNSQSMKMFSSATARYSVDGGNIVEGVESQRNNNDIKEDVNEDLEKSNIFKIVVNSDLNIRESFWG